MEFNGAKRREKSKILFNYVLKTSGNTYVCQVRLNILKLSLSLADWCVPTRNSSMANTEAIMHPTIVTEGSNCRLQQ
jgi:hypothetical protein